MTPLQKNILAACKHRPQTLRELQNALQVDNSRLRNTVTGMVATGMLSAATVPMFRALRDGKYRCPRWHSLHTGQAGGPLRLCVPR